MSKVLLTYDLEERLNESKHHQVKDAMKALGYHDHWTTGEGEAKQTWYLPNTTLWRKDITPSQAKADLESCASKAGAIVERLIAVDHLNWDGITGKPYKK